EAAAERDQIMIAQRLIAKQQHRMLVPCLHHARERRAIERSEIDASHLGPERCPRRDHIERGRSGMLIRGGLCAEAHHFLLGNRRPIEPSMGVPDPLVPAKAGTQTRWPWIPACAGMSGILMSSITFASG